MKILNAVVSADELASLRPTGQVSGGRSLATNGDWLHVWLTADEALRLSQLFAGLADDIRAEDEAT